MLYMSWKVLQMSEQCNLFSYLFVQLEYIYNVKMNKQLHFFNSV